MRTVTENLHDAAESICALLDELFPVDVRLRDMNNGSNITIMGPSHYFPPLDAGQRRVRSRVDDELGHFLAVVNAMMGSRPKDIQRRLSQAEKTLRTISDQGRVNYGSTDAAKAGARKALDSLLAQVSDLHDDAEGETLLIPDTNALLSSPALESWDFDDHFAFQLVLVPSVLSELDELKMSHRIVEVRDKANRLIRQIKEYRRRGRLTEGVPVVRDRITLRALAVEPDLTATLPWLDAASADDRILASCVEVMRLHPRAAVVLITGDINLQNKAEFALVPFLEPPQEEV